MQQSVELYQRVAMTLLRLDRSGPGQETNDPLALHLEVQTTLSSAQSLSRRWTEMDPGNDQLAALEFVTYKLLVQQIANILGIYFLAVPYIFLPAKARSVEASDIVQSLKAELDTRFAALRQVPDLVKMDSRGRVDERTLELMKASTEAMNSIVLPVREIVEAWEVQTRAGDWDKANFQHHQRLQAEVGPNVTIETGFVGPTNRGTLEISFVAVAGERLVWANMSEPQTIHRLDLSAVVKVEDNPEGVFRLTTDDRAGSAQVVEVAALPEEPGLLISSLIEVLNNVAPFYAPSRSTAMRLAFLQRVPVKTWESCPCSGQISERDEHVVRCGVCDRYYADPGFSPDVSRDPSTFGRLDGHETWLPISSSDLRYQNCTQAWVLMPADFPTGPVLIPDHDLIDSSLDISGS